MTQAPELFREAVAALQAVRPRPEVTLESMRAPQRLAPWSYALSCDTTGPADVQATGRLVLLHDPRSEEHTSELQSRFDLVCRLLLEKKKRRECGGDAVGAVDQL